MTSDFGSHVLMIFQTTSGTVRKSRNRNSYDMIKAETCCVDVAPVFWNAFFLNVYAHAQETGSGSEILAVS